MYMRRDKYVVLNKKIGETPLACMEAWRKVEGIEKDVPLAYAGRLDPMASGKLLVLIGDECKNQEKYFGLDKEYEVDVLFGFSSDTGDVLGIAEREGTGEVSQKDLDEVLGKLTGRITLPYPVFSSKTVQGKPLFLWTLEGKLEEIDIPTREVEIYKLQSIEIQTIQTNELKDHIFEKINSIPEVREESKQLGADFRRTEIRVQWNKLFKEIQQDEFQIVTLRCTCSSGTYMRVLAEEIGYMLGTKALAFGIHRTKIGVYRKIIGRFGTWTKKF